MRILGIDLGTSSLLACDEKGRIFLDEPSVIALSRRRKEIIAIGNKAREMVGKTHEDIEAIHPVKNGAITDQKIFENIVRKILKMESKVFFTKPKICISIHSGTTNVEKRALYEASVNAGVKEVYFIHETLASAIGIGMNVSEAKGILLVNIGGGTTDIAVISLGGIVIGDTLKVAGKSMDEAIMMHIRQRYNMMIGENTAEEIKNKIGIAHPDEEKLSLEVKGRKIVDGSPMAITVNSEDVYEAIFDPLKNITLRIKEVIERTPPELISDILEDGIVLTGGVSLLKGMDKFISESLNMNVKKVENPISCVIEGMGFVFGSKKLLTEICEKVG
ncbi:MAG: rod shape-determining protein [Thermotogae bacterium]|nr:rod shape-determining protein [Thermotogota bacterium]